MTKSVVYISRYLLKCISSSQVYRYFIIYRYERHVVYRYYFHMHVCKLILYFDQSYFDFITNQMYQLNISSYIRYIIIKIVIDNMRLRLIRSTFFVL